MSLLTLFEDYSKCIKCPALTLSRKNIVFGIGNPNANILIVKEGPNEDEDRAGEFLQGKAGEWFLSMYMHVSTNEAVVEMAKKAKNKRFKPDWEILREAFFAEAFVTGVVCCRPTLDKGDSVGNTRAPGTKEIQNCASRLLQVVYQVDPLIILAMGNNSISTLGGKSLKVVDKSGHPKSLVNIKIPGVLQDVVYPIIPTYDLEHAMKVGDYDDPNGIVSSFFSALQTAWQVCRNLENEDV